MEREDVEKYVPYLGVVASAVPGRLVIEEFGIEGVAQFPVFFGMALVCMFLLSQLIERVPWPFASSSEV